MGSKPWLKLIVLLFIASQIAAKKFKVSMVENHLIFHDAVIDSDTDLTSVDFSRFGSVEFDDPKVHTLTLKMQEPMASVKKLQISMGKIVTVYVAYNFEDIIIDSEHVQNVLINPGGNYSTVNFAVKNSKINKLPENLSAMKNVQVLNFYNNFIETVEIASLNGLNSLRDLKLTNNKITNVNFFQAVLPNLATVSLANNRLQSIITNDFTAPLLINFDFSENQIETVNMTQFNSFANLKYISLNDNKIKEITSNSVALPKLKSFTINNNQLSHINFEDWNAPALEEMHIEGNLLKSAPGLPAVFPALQRVWLLPNSFTEEWQTATREELKARNIQIFEDENRNEMTDNDDYEMD